MTTVLVVFFLSVRSSYARNSEFEATEDSYDTVQFFCSEGVCWRIRTYAMDQDVHVWRIGAVDDIVALARSNTEKHYGDVLAESYTLETGAGLDGIRERLVERGLPPSLEVSPAGFAFWAPGGSEYRSRTRPGNA